MESVQYWSDQYQLVIINRNDRYHLFETLRLHLLTLLLSSAALFFLTYETCKQKLNEAKSPINGSSDVHHIVAASLGELVSCAIRVPCEVVKMRAQTTESKIVVILEEMLVKGGLKGIYRGFFSTVMRDIPFSIVQYPIWEKLKELHLQRKHQHVNATQSAAYGSIAGAIAAFVTTPIDVAKSRIMLARNAESLASGKVIEAMRLIYQEDGIRGCFAGVVPRVIWISLGAAIFLGTYERVCAPRVF